jgi:VWFA-related protein
VHEVSYGKLPIDVTVALDVSYSVTGALLNRLRQGVLDLMRDLGSEDRLKLVLFNMRVNRTIDFSTDVKAVERAIRGAVAGGGTALLDAVSVTLVSAPVPDRRQLIVFFTDGSDTSSTTPPDMLAGIAERTRATLTFVMPLPAQTVTTAAGRRTATSPTLSGSLFATLARETGGSILHAGPSTNLSATFKQALSEFRSAYVLYYTARGVDRPGYHALEVKVNRDGAEVQARRGYFGS